MAKEWFSRNPNIARVAPVSAHSDHAKVIAVSPGTTEIYAIDDAGNETESFTVTVAEGSSAVQTTCTLRFNVDVTGATVTIGNDTRLCSATMGANPYQFDIDPINGTPVHYEVSADGYETEYGEIVLSDSTATVTLSMTPVSEESTTCTVTIAFDNADLTGTITVDSTAYANVHSQEITVAKGSTINVTWAATGYNSYSKEYTINGDAILTRRLTPITVTDGTLIVKAPVRADFYLNGSKVVENASQYAYEGKIGDTFRCSIKNAVGYLDYEDTLTYSNGTFNAPMEAVVSNLVCTGLPSSLLEGTSKQFTAAIEGNSGSNAVITWSYSADGIVYVTPKQSAQGTFTITAVSTGTVTLTATWTAATGVVKTQTFTVKVVNDEITITSSLDDMGTIYVPNGGDLTFTASAVDSLGNDVEVAVVSLNSLSGGAATARNLSGDEYVLHGTTEGSLTVYINAGAYTSGNMIAYKATKSYTVIVSTKPATLTVDKESIEMVKSTTVAAPPGLTPFSPDAARTHATLNCTSAPSGADGHLSWASSDRSKVTAYLGLYIVGQEPVSRTCSVFGEDYGTANLTLSLAWIGDTSTPIVTKTIPVSVYAVIADRKTMSVNVGETETIGISEIESGYSAADVKFTSYNPDKATVNSSGVVTGIYPGFARIAVFIENTGSVYWVTVYVNATNTTYINGVSIDDVSLYSGETAEITAALDVTTDYALMPAERQDPELVWTSSDASVATVAIKGGGNKSSLRAIITGVSAGTATITATTGDGRYSDTCTVTVIAARKRISYNWKWVASNGSTVISNTLPTNLQPSRTYKFLLTINEVDSVQYTGSVNAYLSSSVTNMTSAFTGSWNASTGIFTLNTPYAFDGDVPAGMYDFDDFQDKNITLYANFSATSDYKGTTYNQTFGTAKKLKATFENNDSLQLKVGEYKTWAVTEAEPELYVKNNSYHGYVPDFTISATAAVDFAPIFKYASHTGGLNPVYSEVFGTEPWYEDIDNNSDGKLAFVGPTLYGKSDSAPTITFGPKVYADNPHRNTSYYGSKELRISVDDAWIADWKTAHPQSDPYGMGLDIKGLSYGDVEVFNVWIGNDRSSVVAPLSISQQDITVHVVSRYIDGRKLPFKLTYGNAADAGTTEALGEGPDINTLNTVNWSSDADHFVVLGSGVAIPESDAERTDLESVFTLTVSALSEGSRDQYIDVTTVYGTIRLVISQTD